MWYTILLKCALTHYDTFYYYIMQAFFCQGRFFIFVGMPLKHVLSCFFFVNLHKPDGTAADSKGNPAQNPPDGFARNLCADFPSDCPRQSAEKSDNAPYAQALCGVAQNLSCRLSLHFL